MCHETNHLHYQCFQRFWRADGARNAKERGVDPRTTELDVASDESNNAGTANVIADKEGLNAVIDNAGHMSFGPAKAFTPEQFV
jgi:hypothetical protein